MSIVELQYVEATGNQVVDINFIPNGNTTVECSYAPNAVTSYQGIWSARNQVSTVNSHTMFIIGNDYYRYDLYGTAFSIYVDDISSKKLIKTTKTSVQVGATTQTFTTRSGTSPEPMVLFASYATSNTFGNYCNGKLYYFKVWDNGVLVRDLIPVNKDGVIGLLDNLTDVFYSPIQGTLTGGPIKTGDVYDLTQGIPSSYKTGDILDIPYSGKAISITLKKGTYKLECWGAQGGYRSSSTYGGKGGYSVGTLTLSTSTLIYAYAGGSGNTGGTSGGFNGGGKRATHKGGGGGSDIRIGSSSLYARVIVAGGGGSDGSSSRKGGYGGGTVGQANQGGGYGTNNGPGKTTYSGSSSSTTADSQSTGTSSSTDIKGGFGFGGNGCYRSNGYGGAGGGGWYGGSGTYPDTSGDDDKSGSGGSGYVYTSSTASQYPSGCLLNSSHYLTSASTTNGGTSFKSPSGSSETGHSGDGYCRITVIEVDSSGFRVKVNGAWKESSGTYVNVNGTWREVQGVYVKVNGTWKEAS